MAKRKPSKTISQQVRDEVAARGLTAYRIAKDSGISEMNLYRLLGGRTEGTTQTFEALLEYLGAELHIPPPKSK